MRSPLRLSKAKVIVLALAALALALQGLNPPLAWSQQSEATVALLTFNRAALRGDLDTAGRLMSSRFLRSTSFERQRRLDPARLAKEVRLMAFYQVLQEEELPGPNVRVKVLQQRLVGGQGFVTRWYYMVREDGIWKLDRIGPEMPYR